MSSAPEAHAIWLMEGGREAETVLEGTRVVIFDCDGVLWRGTEVIPGAIETVESLMARGIAVFFITNNSTRSRAMYTSKFASKGFPNVKETQILSASYAAAAYLSGELYGPEGKGEGEETKAVYVVGEVGIMDELRLAGFDPLGGPDQDALTMAELEAYTPDPRVAAVVVGADTAFSYTKGAVAMQYLARGYVNGEGKTPVFVASNPDTSFPTMGNFLPGAGMAVAAVTAVAGRDPVVVGKPSSFLLDDVLARVENELGAKIDKSEILMVGDRLDTDILFGRAGGISTLLVMSGVENEASLDAAVERGVEAHLPHYVAHDVTRLQGGANTCSE